MDTTTSDRRQTEAKIPCGKVPNAMMQPTSDSGVMGAPSSGGKMPGEVMPGDVMPGASMGRASATGKMPGEGMDGGAMGGASAIAKTMGETPSPGKMPGEGMRGAGMEAPSGTMPGRAPAGTGRHHVFVKEGESVEAAAGVALGPYTKRGSTANFDVYYDNSLGTNGQNLADAVLANCEWDFFELRGWFGDVAAGRFSVYIDPGPSAPTMRTARPPKSTALPSAAPMAHWKTCSMWLKSTK